MACFPLRCRRFQHNNKRFKSQLKIEKKIKKGGLKNMQEKIEKLRVEMQEISVEQQNIREGQRQLREKFEGIESKCDELKRETRITIQQTARTQIKVALMFRILKVKEQAENATAAQLTNLLREIVEEENEERRASGDS